MGEGRAVKCFAAGLRLGTSKGSGAQEPAIDAVVLLIDMTYRIEAGSVAPGLEGARDRAWGRKRVGVSKGGLRGGLPTLPRCFLLPAPSLPQARSP